MKRRTFLKNSSISTLGLSIGSLGLSSFDTNDHVKHITILHTNDVHSQIDPFPRDHPRNPGMGGAAKRAYLIDQIRKENPNVLLLDAGDSFQGTPYFNYYGGALEFKIMSMMGYDATTIGNHEFDNGIEGLAAQMPHAKFEILSANYDFSKTIMAPFVKPYKVFNVDGIRIGVFGLGIELQGLVNKNMYKETVYLDPVEITQDMVKTLRKNEKCDLVICLSHLGYQYKNDPQKISDITLAQITTGIDLIIGGHTHTFLDKPSVVKNLDHQEVLINQVGCCGIHLGRIDFFLTKNKKASSNGRSIEI